MQKSKSGKKESVAQKLKEGRKGNVVQLKEGTMEGKEHYLNSSRRTVTDDRA